MSFMTAPYYFNDNYAEDATLSDGTRVRLRLVRPSDKEMLVRAFERLSPESRYRRFFTAKNSLSPSELRHLTEVDGVNHFAIGAVTPRPAGGEEEGLGIARFVRLENSPHVAEPAIVVLDDVQGKGLGRLLLHRLVAAALERGITRFRSSVLISNEPMRALIRELAPDATVTSDGDVLGIELLLPQLPHDHPAYTCQRENPLYQLLALVAKRAVDVRRATAERMKDEG